MKDMKHFAHLGTAALLLLAVVACCHKQQTPQVEGHYTYEHTFDYAMDGNHFDVSETGTMDFYADGTALDSARQTYTVALKDGDTITWIFNYISPSRWRLEGDDFYFAGIKEQFRMELIEGGDREAELSQKIVNAYSGGADYEYKFHLDTLTADLLQWSFIYPDGHSDTWQFYKK